MGRFFYGAYQIISRNRIWSAVGLLFVLIGLGVVDSKIEFEEDITKLIPIESSNKDFEKVLRTVNFADKIILNIQRQPQGSIDDLTTYGSDFLDSIQSSSGSFIKTIQGKVGDADIRKTFNFVYENLPLFLDAADYVEIGQKLEKDSVAKINRENYKSLLSPTGLVVKQNLLRDPLGLSFIALKKFQSVGVGDGFTLHNGFLISEDENNILLFLTPEYPPNETAKNQKFVENLYAVQNQLNARFNGKVKGEYFGATLVAVANAQQIKKDIQFTAGIALTILLIILILFYKKLTVPLILFLPTLVGGLISMAFLYFIRGKISAISLGIGSVLIGVTLDYALHVLTHIRSNNSIKNLFFEVAPSIMMSALTTAAAFLCLLFLKSQALQDLGIFAAVSVMGASIFALLFIPQVYSKTVEKTVTNTVLDRIAAYDFHKNKWGITLIVILLLSSMFTYNKVVFNKDLAKLNFEPQHLIDAQQRLDVLMDVNSKSMYLATYGENLENVLQTNDSLLVKLVSLKKANVILGYNSVGNLVLSNKKQREKIKAWEKFWDANTVDSLQNNLTVTGEKLGFKATTYNPFYTFLKQPFRPIELNAFNDLNVLNIEDYIASEDDFTTVTTLIKVDSVKVPEVRETFENAKNSLLIDRQGMNETFLGHLKNDFNRLIGFSVVAVLLLLLIFYRSLSLTIVTSIPIFLTWFITIGIMGFLRIEFNIFNIIISTFIFGLGVDYSIFVTNGLLHEYRIEEHTLTTHKTSIILSVITTILGLGVLIFAKHPALYTISLVSLIGIFSAAFVAFTMQPLLFRLFIGSSTKRPIRLRYLLHSVLSFAYFGLGGLLFSFYAFVVLHLFPKSSGKRQLAFHRMVSKLMQSVLYTNPFVRKKVINESKENFDRPAMIIANHTSFLDILAIGMLSPKIIYLVNDWVYNSPVFGSAAKLAGAYPVSGGIEKGEAYLQEKVAQGFSLIAFPEGTRSRTNQMRRFHKGAFYLAERFQLDILPVLIHGNSEVLAKGTFIIKDGSITIKILDRILQDDTQYGKGYRVRTKNIGTFFKNEFQNLRKELEDATYFHALVLENFRYKGNDIYKMVHKDLKTNAINYKTILDTVGRSDQILHLSQDYGQLDFLLTLDSSSRKIIRFMEDKTARQIFENCYIAQNYKTLKAVNTVEEAMSFQTKVLIIDMTSFDINKWKTKIQTEITILILLKEGKQLSDAIRGWHFHTIRENDGLIILKRNRT
ncbi:MAG: MMPL family transporter [Maribacter sp.]|nr:MMPL family transporter [Maribacter sp.]